MSLLTKIHGICVSAAVQKKLQLSAFLGSSLVSIANLFALQQTCHIVLLVPNGIIISAQVLSFPCVVKKSLVIRTALNHP